ncbi:hypothetical protein [Crocosphaera sp. Alani8]|uniref:hypothetical protein n=1 Tax=Crocosphaera sp. Alani8 TaxID=3038952 RepID=UPI00313CDC64
MSVILFVAALLVCWLVFRWLFAVAKSTATTVITIGIIIFLLQFAFGITSQDLLKEIINLPQRFQQLLSR